MKGCMSTDLGIITIDPEVIAKICRNSSGRMFWYSRNGACEYERWTGSSVKRRKA